MRAPGGALEPQFHLAASSAADLQSSESASDTQFRTSADFLLTKSKPLLLWATALYEGQNPTNLLWVWAPGAPYLHCECMTCKTFMWFVQQLGGQLCGCRVHDKRFNFLSLQPLLWQHSVFPRRHFDQIQGLQSGKMVSDGRGSYNLSHIVMLGILHKQRAANTALGAGSEMQLLSLICISCCTNKQTLSSSF